MNILVTQGMRIETKCRYVKFTKKRYLDIRQDDESSCLYIDFPKGFNSGDIIDTRLHILTPKELHETDYIKIINPVADLNGLKLKRLTKHDYTINQYIVKDLDKFYMNYDEHHCEVLIPRMLSYRLDKYVCLFHKNPYLEVICDKQLKSLSNFYSINLGDRDIRLKSTNTFEFNTKSKYTKYLLDGITVQESFIDQLRQRLLSFGLELLSLPIDKNTHSNHRVTYRFTDLNHQLNHKDNAHPLRWAVQMTSHIDLKISTPDLVVFNDFRNRYQNLDLVSNFTEFYTNDKLGRNWISSVKWSEIDTSFNQDYAQDEQSNIAFEAGFSADIEYYIVYDEVYYRAQQVILDIFGSNLQGKKETSTIVTI